MSQSSFLYVTGVLCGCVSLATAVPPKQPNVGQFSKLINESPFTVKPQPMKTKPKETPLERDWMLGSIRPSESGYAVTLINKKDRKDRIRFLPGLKAGDFELLDVKQDVKNSSNSRVQVRKGGQTAWLSYDEKLIKVRTTAVAKNPPGKVTRNRGRGANPSTPKVPSTTRAPRQRTVPRKK